MLLTLRGTPFLYQGDEIGQVDGVLEKAELLDPVGVRFWPYAGRDPERTPMPWHGGPGGGFTEPGVRPWLPMADPAPCNVADQEGDPASVLELCRRAIAARAASDDLAVGAYRSLPSPEGTWAYARGEGDHGPAQPVGRPGHLRRRCAAWSVWPPTPGSKGRAWRAH